LATTTEPRSEVSSLITLRNEHLDKRLLSYDEPNVLRMSGVWELPFGPQKRFFRREPRSGGPPGRTLDDSVIFYKTSGTPTGFSDPAVTGGTPGSGGAFNNSTPNPTQLGPLPTGSVYKRGNNVLYFTGLTQVQDPTAKLLPANLQSQNPLHAIQGPSGNIRIESPPPGALGSLSPN
jgi:hypothetical protein